MKVTLTGIILFVENVEKLKNFYIENFHLELTEEIESQWVLLKAGLCELGLHAVGAEYTQANQTPDMQESNTKMVFEMEEDIFVAHQKLTANHVALTEIKTWDSYPYWICNGKDPEGNTFQLRMKK